MECAGRMQYLAIVEKKVERSRERFERTEGTCGVSHPTEQLDRGGYSIVFVRFLLIGGGARFEGLVGTNNFWSVIREGRGAYI